jgi:hypothetical protein
MEKPMNQQTQLQELHDRRLKRVRQLIEKHQVERDWGTASITEIIDPANQAAARPCPRYAGVVEESDDPHLLLDETPGGLAEQMADHLTGEAPKTPGFMVDLDTGQIQPAHLTAHITFGDPPSKTLISEKLVLLAITHDHGADHMLARTEQDARALLHAFVTRWWDYEARSRPLPAKMPSDPDDAIRVYFEQVKDEHWEISTIDPPAAAAPLAASSTKS